MAEKKMPNTCQVIVNNIGVKPAGVIATTTLYKSCDWFKNNFPEVVVQIKQQSYIDDIGLTDLDVGRLAEKTQQADKILEHTNMKVKRWIVSGDSQGKVEVGKLSDDLTLEDADIELVLGIVWQPGRDVFKFSVKINLSPLRKKSRIGADLSKKELLTSPPNSISRRKYSQVQALFDPNGFLSPVLVKGKVTLRTTWKGECKNLDWDESLLKEVMEEIIQFFISLFELEDVKFPWSLWPRDKTVGDPKLVVFSDGSVKAFGAVVYWKLESGSWWSILMMSKSKIGPKNRVSIPRMAQSWPRG